jgi:hypothetical protein
MSRSLFIAFVAAAFLVVPAALPSAFVPAMAPGLSGSALAALNLNTSRSNIYRTKHSKNTKTHKARGGGGVEDRMGGGGGARGGAARMGGGGGARGGAARMGGGGGHGQTK